MNSPTIEVVIDPQGNVRLQTSGFSGSNCRQASAALESALGIVQAEQPTSEFYQTQSLPQSQKQKS